MWHWWETSELRPNAATELGGGGGGSTLAQRETGERSQIERERESELSGRGLLRNVRVRGHFWTIDARER